MPISVPPEVAAKQQAQQILTLPTFSTLPPEIQTAIQQMAAGQSDGKSFVAAVQAAKARGVALPDSPWWIPAAIMGGLMGGFGLSALGGGGAAAGAGGAGAAGATGAGAAGASGAAAAGGNAFTRFLGSAGGAALLGTGTNLLGAYLQTRANGKATAAELDARRQALDLQTQMYNQNMGLNVAQANNQMAFDVGRNNQNTAAYNQTGQNLTPYRNIGANALSMLGWGAGLPGYETGNTRVVNPAQPWRDAAPLTILPLATPPPITLPGTSPAATTGRPDTTGVQWATGGQTSATQNASGVRAPQVGDQRMVNGQPARWDGSGWVQV